MKFSIPFNKEVYIAQIELMIPFVYYSIHKKQGYLLPFLLFILLIAILGLIDNHFLGYVFLVFSLIIGTQYFLNFRTYNKFKTNMMERQRIEAERLGEQMTNGIFEFNDDNIKYSDNSVNRTLTWEEVNEFQIKNSVLFIIVEATKGDILALGKEEIGDINFKKLREFIKLKEKQTPHNNA